MSFTSNGPASATLPFFFLAIIIGSAAGGLDLAEEGVDAPEVVLAPFAVERVIVALHALGAQAKEEPGGARGDRDHVPAAVLVKSDSDARPFLLSSLDFFAEVVGDVVDGRVLVGLARGGQDVGHDRRPVGHLLVGADVGVKSFGEPVAHLSW